MKKKKKFSPIFVISLNIHRTIRSQLSFYCKKITKKQKKNQNKRRITAAET